MKIKQVMSSDENVKMKYELNCKRWTILKVHACAHCTAECIETEVTEAELKCPTVKVTQDLGNSWSAEFCLQCFEVECH